MKKCLPLYLLFAKISAIIIVISKVIEEGSNGVNHTPIKLPSSLPYFHYQLQVIRQIKMSNGR